MLFVLKESTGTERCTAAEDAAPLSATCPAAAEVAAPLSATCPPPCSPPDAAPPAQVPPRDHQSIQRQILEGQACLLRPMEFFISWGGLPTLAFAGFPTPLLTLKARGGAAGEGKRGPGALRSCTTLTLKGSGAGRDPADVGAPYGLTLVRG